jgi:hypothetical protein
MVPSDLKMLIVFRLSGVGENPNLTPSANLALLYDSTVHKISETVLDVKAPNPIGW